MSDQALPPAALSGPSLDAEQVRARLVDVWTCRGFVPLL